MDFRRAVVTGFITESEMGKLKKNLSNLLNTLLKCTNPTSRENNTPLSINREEEVNYLKSRKPSSSSEERRWHNIALPYFSSLALKLF